jgi:hypothetical protein
MEIEYLCKLFENTNTQEQEKLSDYKPKNKYKYNPKEDYDECIERLNICEKAYIHEDPKKFLRCLRQVFKDIEDKKDPHFIEGLFIINARDIFYNVWMYLIDTENYDDEIEYPRRNLLINLRILCHVFFQISLIKEPLEVYPAYYQQYRSYKDKFDGKYNAVPKSFTITKIQGIEYMYMYHNK